MHIEELVQAAKMKKEEAMEELIETFMPYILKRATQTYISGYEFQDLVQIGRISVLRAVQRFEEERNRNFTAYVTNAIEKNFYYEIRKKYKERGEISLFTPTDSEGELQDILPDPENIEENYVQGEVRKALRHRVQQLPPEQRELIDFVYFQRKTLKEYAKVVGKSYGICVKLKKKALERLKKDFRGWS